jgi:hypothetical protein
VKERQDSIAARIAGTIAGGVRRRQQGRAPRALLYDATGEPRVVPAGGDEHAGLVAAAEALVEVVLGDEGEAEPEASGAGADDAALSGDDPAGGDDPASVADDPAPARPDPAADDAEPPT